MSYFVKLLNNFSKIFDLNCKVLSRRFKRKQEKFGEKKIVDSKFRVRENMSRTCYQYSPVKRGLDSRYFARQN
jgi:hypothetical protein